MVPPLAVAHEFTSFDATPASLIEARIADADIVITNKTPLGEAAIAASPKLRLIAIAATGTDVVDLAACRARGVAVCNIRGYALHTVPEHTFALILALRRNLLAYRASVAAGRWQQAGQFCYFDYPIKDLAGSTLGVCGGGALGSAVARLGRAFGMEVLSAGRKGEALAREGYVPFDEMLRRADVITLHCPLTPATRHLIGAPEFARMARRPLLINTGRGGLVDEVALGEALRSGQIAGAGFDVASEEPPPPGHSLLTLLDLPNFILTPHVAWASEEAMQTLADQLIANIDAFLADEPRNLVQ
ncbi:MAG: D-2-hydroxyacid dehydrogenase [Rhodospirillales bacterium]|nr:D-2-hydroxyacid dehydrogenase [Rhodospirillales bacterium]MDE2390474.1 D-2-hydroxyacid dehydrogenase [Rhodospirillales bacterium]